MADKQYDVVIIGGGTAGLSAAIYTARSRRSTVIIEKGAVGGQVINSSLVENYPGFEGSGFDLTEAIHKQAKKFGAEELFAEVTGIAVADKKKVVRTSRGDINARAIIIAGGLERQKLGVPGEAEYTGKGVSYCATCDGAFFRDKAVAVVGGGNAAITEALELVRFASKIALIHRRGELRAMRILQERVLAEPKITTLWDSVIEAITGDGAVRQLKIKNIKTGKQSSIDVAGVFVSIGFQPSTAYLKDVVELDDGGSVIVNEMMETSVPGIFAAGDIRHESIRQLIAAAGDGAVAAIAAERYLTGG